MKPSRPELRALTGLRGMAAICVALGHFQQLYLTNAPFMWDNAVDLFFCLSGFTLSYVYRPEDIRFSHYLTARIARIYPLYFVTLVIVGGAIVWPLQIDSTTYPVGHALSDFLLQVLMLNSWPLIGSGVHWNSPAWSVSVEWFCYVLLFPLLLFQKAPRSTAIRLLCIVLLSATAYSLFVRHFDSNLFIPMLYEPKSQWSYWVDLFRGVFSFTAGWIVFSCYDRRDALYTFCTKSSALLWSSVVLLIALAYCDRINSQALMLLYPFVVLAATDQTSVASRLLGSRPLHFLGLISYSIYMTHYVLFIGVVAVFGLPATWKLSIYPLVAGICLAMFIGSYLVIERPARDAIRRPRCMHVIGAS
ncbi:MULTISPECIES: acyltransferase family protein [Bradyrhizobium]|uniref:Acyltransferase n=1 Tax=Bradyrhizobium brasilense TaxID=1419277 RepID=A0ABY8JCB4_9BRAD|nr:acyltransferase [Bradyrhizobium brasilense]WFU61407.1 acyltransferase [Bradyrhizobium brasilense]